MKIVPLHGRAEQTADPAAVLPELLGILSELSTLQSRTARLAQMLVTTSVAVKADPELDQVLSALSDALQEQPGTTESTSPANCDVSADGEASSGAVPQDEAPQAGTGSEMLADREGHSAKGAGEDEASAADLRSHPAPTIPVEAPAAEQPEVLKVEDIVETVVVTVDEPSGPAAPTKPQSIPAGLSSLRVFRRLPKVADEDEGSARLRIPSVPAAPPKFMPVVPAIEEPKRTPAADFDPGKIMVVDVEAAKIHGPLGTIDVAKPFARSMERMVDGGTYDVDTLRDLGPWPRTDALKDHFSTMRRKLAGVGVDLVTVNKFMFRVQRLGV